MENYLDIDLNEIASKRIAQRIESLEKQVENLQEKNLKLSTEIGKKDKDLEKSKTSIGIVNKLREAFNNLTLTYTDKENDYYDSKQKNQYLFIEKIMSHFFEIEKEMNGWYCYRSSGNLRTHLAINFYTNKDLVVNILELIKENSQDEIRFINDYRMPYDYSKEDVIAFLKSPQYNTNGAIFEVNQYWIESGAGKSNMPHGLIYKSPFIKEDDVFDILVNSIESRVSNYYYLYGVTRYANISDKQISKLGETVITLHKTHFNYEEVQKFISSNLLKLNEKTLDFLYPMISDDNQFKLLNWQKFPYKYQVKYLKTKNFEQVMKILSSYDCKWSLEEKEQFFKQYAKQIK